MVSFMSVFPFCAGLIDFAASLAYLIGGQRALALTWFCYGVSAIALGMVKNA